MNFNRDRAKVLSTARELELFDNARPPRLNKLTEAELKDMVKHSRTLRDKLRDVKHKQTRSKQSMVAQRGTDANARSAEKAQLYSEVHDVFVARLADVLAGGANTAKKKTEPKQLLASAAVSRMSASDVGAPPKTTTARSAKVTYASKSAAAEPAVESTRTSSVRGKTLETRIARSGITPKRSHISATNKRNQSRRDSK